MLHGKCWRTVLTHELLTYQRSERVRFLIQKQRVGKYIPYEALYMWYCVYYLYTETFTILVAFLF